MAMDDRMMKTVLKASITGVTTALLGNYTFGGGGVSVFGYMVPSWAILGLTGASSSLISDLAHNTLLPLIPQNKKFLNAESAILGVSTAGLSSALLLSLSVDNFPQQNFIMGGVVGASSYVLSDFITENILTMDNDKGASLIF